MPRRNGFLSGRSSVLLLRVCLTLTLELKKNAQIQWGQFLSESKGQLDAKIKVIVDFSKNDGGEMSLMRLPITTEKGRVNYLLQPTP